MTTDIIRFWYIDLTPEQFEQLKKRLQSRFHFSLTLTYDAKKKEMRMQMATMGRSLYPDESCEAIPFKLGKPVSIDSIRLENIGCFINGYLFAKENDEN